MLSSLTTKKNIRSFAVTPENPRAMKAEVLGEIAKKYCHNVTICDSAISSLDLIKSEITENDMLFVVGSLYLAGEVRNKLIKIFD
mgnify:CR=1 FL=1